MNINANELKRMTLTLNDGKEIRVYVNSKENYKFPSVTVLAGYIEPSYLVKWRKNNPHWKEILQYAGIVGTITHWRCSLILCKEWGYPIDILELTPEQVELYKLWKTEFEYESKRLGVDYDVKLQMVAFQHWKNLYKPKPPFRIVNGRKIDVDFNPCEFKIVSQKYGFAGTCDLLCSLINQKTGEYENCFVDFKTNENISSKYPLQLTAYRMGFEEKYGKDYIPIANNGIAILNITHIETNWEWDFNQFIYNKNGWLKHIKGFWTKYGDHPELMGMKKRVLAELSKVRVF